MLRGFHQIENINYNETYTSVMRNETIRLLLSLAAKNDWEIGQMDAITAFLNLEVDHEIYIW